MEDSSSTLVKLSALCDRSDLCWDTSPRLQASIFCASYEPSVLITRSLSFETLSRVKVLSSTR